MVRSEGSWRLTGGDILCYATGGIIVSAIDLRTLPEDERTERGGRSQRIYVGDWPAAGASPLFEAYSAADPLDPTEVLAMWTQLDSDVHPMADLIEMGGQTWIVLGDAIEDTWPDDLLIDPEDWLWVWYRRGGRVRVTQLDGGTHARWLDRLRRRKQAEERREATVGPDD